MTSLFSWFMVKTATRHSVTQCYNWQDTTATPNGDKKPSRNGDKHNYECECVCVYLIS